MQINKNKVLGYEILYLRDKIEDHIARGISIYYGLNLDFFFLQVHVLNAWFPTCGSTLKTVQTKQWGLAGRNRALAVGLWRLYAPWLYLTLSAS